MNMSNDERFHELAHKALGKEATPAEQRELRALIAEKPELKQELEQMSTEVAAVREILPLLEDIQHPRHGAPAPPMQRLQRQVQEVFESRAESPRELRDLLARLEKWAGRQIGVERERVMELISSLRTSLSAAAGGEQVMAEASMLRAPMARYAAAPRRLREEAEVHAIRETEEEESRKRTAAEFEKRLRSLEARLSQAEHVTHECREEMRGLIEAFTREQEAWAERKRTRPNQPSQPRE